MSENYVKRRLDSRDLISLTHAHRLVMEPDLENTHCREELSRFLAKVDEVGKQTYKKLTTEDIVL